ncbi:NUDIX hydrolase [Paraglaciecola chathamensis]|uniref:NUDIX hydrolase n=1 Tax=Paraglaciecola chathamensis TaxID=368405 RepID=UPI002704A000|nr:NUDIX hydrolase [Paraglaciecola chathamensis]MDO6560939.1 NUDIX hydrolase [Paraglaciecola chathamensis]
MPNSAPYIPNNTPPAELRYQGRAVKPKDAATLIIVRRDNTHPQILMGKRSSEHKFMPNKFVFPGGKVDVGDSRIRPPNDLHPSVLQRLMKGCSESRARALALAAIRETFEETGLLLGEADNLTIKSRSLQWQAFLQHGINPRLDTLSLIARAITPPYRNRRFDTRFFMVDADIIQGDVHEAPQGSGELLAMHWVSLVDAEKLDLPIITRMILKEVKQRLTNGQTPEAEGPFIYFRNGKPVIDKI